jgi:hypothetical protein
VASANFGRSFTAIGPRTAAGTASDDVFFLGHQDGWFAVFSAGPLAETLYRTTDGGRTWHGYAAPGHNLAAGSGDIVQFLRRPAAGWCRPWLMPRRSRCTPRPTAGIAPGRGRAGSAGYRKGDGCYNVHPRW